MSSIKIKAVAVPHSWSFETWPATVYPGTTSRARYVVRAHRDELIREGALARVGKEIIILGDRYARWLQRHTADVPNYQIAANKPRERPESEVAA